MPKDEERDLFEPVQLSNVFPKVRPLSRVQRRLIRSTIEIEADDPESILFHRVSYYPSDKSLW